MVWLERFVLMLQFMTRIPVKLNVRAEREDFAKGLVVAPVIGLIIGVFLAVFHYLLGFIFPAFVNAVLTVALYVFLTGGLHLDGLGDTADGLFSNRPRERILEIMKDSRVGTNAVLAIVLVLLLDISLISSLENQAFEILLLMPAAGRIGSLIGSGTSKYAGISDGPGRWCVELCGWKEALAGSLISAVIFTAVSGFYGFALLLLAIFSAIALARSLGKKLGGVTGDILGAVCELNQTVFLLASVILMKIL
ncbi:MAG TPA: adenosylcobinamide-GDP ribazoletransferase [Clostridia bacterium]|nr:adenosylcobinamide-GDP ribazoletransferase [Clostridia bacterium]